MAKSHMFEIVLLLGADFLSRLESMAPNRLADRNHAHYPSRHCTILKKRRLNDGLPERMIRSTRESSEDVFTYPYHTKSMVQMRASFHRKKEGSENKFNEKYPKGQVYQIGAIGSGLGT